MKITFLGTGSSAGTPVIACQCPVCHSSDPRNHRRRASILVEQGDTVLLVDTGPDLRQQMLDARVQQLNAVLYTHFHADHINGIDDLRAFNFAQKIVIPCYADEKTATELETRFRYCFLPPDAAWAKPSLSMHRFTSSLTFGALPVTPVPIMHGKLAILGFRFGDVAYLTDLKSIPDESLLLLQNLNLLILDCLRYEAHPTHLNVEEALYWTRRIGARQTIFTHMTHDIDYAKFAAELPAGITPAYDGMVIQP
ncbi:MBL fold metallo-hydrolase [Acidithiobacillus montserratensis]|uniref:MBL fold metallo-hydrolase n=1 Tax=Acidithiobacillus montserratensis TaxID=2729135 RepID=A0ACD5HBM2_9PROT|nr:MBL fold metallo-hydrolase [Acidithiobacillus montserratensis]MBU2746666.1 MBL fold metallo-hydrolase [Acidithiobacillus montserratensis]